MRKINHVYSKRRQIYAKGDDKKSILNHGSTFIGIVHHTSEFSFFVIYNVRRQIIDVFSKGAKFTLIWTTHIIISKHNKNDNDKSYAQQLLHLNSLIKDG